MPSFDIVSEVDRTELRNAVDQANREIGTRFDFKGSGARIEQVDFALILHADTDFQLDQVLDVLQAKLAKRGVDVRSLDATGKAEKVSGNKVKRQVLVKHGIDTELAKRIVRQIKDSRLKVTASIQGESVRVSGAKRDALQACMSLLRQAITEVPLQFQNFRD